MSITSGIFILFAAALLILFYAVPKKGQWIVLLAASLFFYAMTGIKNCLYILITALSAYLVAIFIEKLTLKQKKYLKENKDLSKEDKAKYKNGMTKKRRALLVTALLLNFGILCFFKYTNFVLEQVNGIFSSLGSEKYIDALDLIVPLGLSFYTFQTMGYVADVYWKKTDAQKNFFKMLLFVSFFPQITQGPISNYSYLSEQLFATHPFKYKNLSRGFQRLVWGFAKKIILADLLAPYVADVFENYANYTGITVLCGAFFYSIQIYADFSGYMDIVCGLCEMLDIRLSENFDRPYFSKSIAEYWRRWHITLGDWFKTYIYYPIAVSKWNQKIGKLSQKRFGKHIGQTIPASIALVAVWLTTGLWHGASWGYIAWGGVNGIFIIFSLWMEPVYELCKKKLRIPQSSWYWRAFQTVRTFFLVTLIKVLPEVGTLSDGIGLWKKIFTDFEIPKTFAEFLPFAEIKELNVIIIATVILFISSLIQRKQPIRDWFAGIRAPFRYIILALLVLVTLYYGCSGSAGGFLYAQF